MLHFKHINLCLPNCSRYANTLYCSWKSNTQSFFSQKSTLLDHVWAMHFTLRERETLNAIRCALQFLKSSISTKANSRACTGNLRWRWMCIIFLVYRSRWLRSSMFYFNAPKMYEISRTISIFVAATLSDRQDLQIYRSRAIYLESHWYPGICLVLVFTTPNMYLTPTTGRTFLTSFSSLHLARDAQRIYTIKNSYLSRQCIQKLSPI